jgi:hypothetical protein
VRAGCLNSSSGKKTTAAAADGVGGLLLLLLLFCLPPGGSLPQGWDCSLRCRITSRRHGRQGLTTDNYYYSPCGKTFRTHKQVVQHLGLTPVSRQQLKQQQSQPDSDSEQELLPEHFNIISVTVLASAAKRSHSAMTATDSEVTAARPAASAPAAVVAAPAEQDHQQAVSWGAPAALPAHSSQSAPAQMPSVAAAPTTKRTKAALAAKYASSCSASLSAASLAVSTATASVAAAPAAASGLPCCSSTLSTATHAASTTASADAVACQQQLSPVLAAVRHTTEQQAQLQNPLSLATPAASSNNSSSSRRSSGSKAVSSSRQPAMQPAPKQPVVKQPVPKPWKPRAQPAWRLKLRELATAAVLAEGLGPAAAPSNDSAAADTKSG